MGLFSRKRQRDEADLIYEQAKQRAYAREVRKIAAVKGYKTGQQLAQQRFNGPTQSSGGILDGLQKHRAFFENIANSNWSGVETPDIMLSKKRKQ